MVNILTNDKSDGIYESCRKINFVYAIEMKKKHFFY